MADPSELIAGFPPWVQILAGVVASIGVGGAGVQQYLSKKAETKAAAVPAAATPAAVPQAEHFDPDELLESGPVVRLLADISEIAANAKLQTEALRNLSAVATLVGERLQQGYSELVVFKAVHEALKEEREQRWRDRGPSGSGGWGGP